MRKKRRISKKLDLGERCKVSPQCTVIGGYREIVKGGATVTNILTGVSDTRTVRR